MRRLTAKPEPTTDRSFRMPQRLHEAWFQASKRLGVSQAQFVREALTERIIRVLGRDKGLTER